MNKKKVCVTGVFCEQFTIQENGFCQWIKKHSGFEKWCDRGEYTYRHFKNQKMKLTHIGSHKRREKMVPETRGQAVLSALNAYRRESWLVRVIDTVRKFFKLFY